MKNKKLEIFNVANGYRLYLILVGAMLFFCFFVYTHAYAKTNKGGIMKVTSSAFKDNTMIPSKYTCDGMDINPPLIVEDIPEKTKSLVLIVDDPDAPGGTWTHWVVFNIPYSGKKLEIKENSILGIQGWNDFRKVNYGGPCPPFGTHRYFFKIYALDIMLNLNKAATKQEVENAMRGHILASAELVGLYKRK
jgi:Raf kinase inhibitor-like YbhB/YbcL family protein